MPILLDALEKICVSNYFTVFKSSK